MCAHVHCPHSPQVLPGLQILSSGAGTFSPICCHYHTLPCFPMPHFCGEMLPSLQYQVQHSHGLLRLQPVLEISHGLCNNLTLCFSVLIENPRLLQASICQVHMQTRPCQSLLERPTSSRPACLLCLSHLKRIHCIHSQLRKGRAGPGCLTLLGTRE